LVDPVSIILGVPLLKEILQTLGLNAITSKISYAFKKPTYDKIKKEKIMPCLNEIVSDCNGRLSTHASAEEIGKLIDFESGASVESKTELVGRKLIISLSESAIKHQTLGYDTAEKIAIFVFQRATNFQFRNNREVNAVAQHVILPDALSKVENDYGNKFMSENIVNKVAVEHFSISTDKRDYFKTKIFPLLKPGNDKTIFSKIKSEAKARKYTINPQSPIYEKYKRNEEMSSQITESEMVGQTLVDVSDRAGLFHYVRGLRYIFENPDCRLTDISSGLGISMGTAQWVAWKHWKNTKLVDKDGKKYRVSQKYLTMRAKIEEEKHALMSGTKPVASPP